MYYSISQIDFCLFKLHSKDRERKGGRHGKRGREKRMRKNGRVKWDFKDSSNKFGKCQTFYFSWQFRNVFCIFAMEEFSHKGKCSTLSCTIFPKQSWEGIGEQENSPVQPVEMPVPAPRVFSPPSHERDPRRESWSLIRTVTFSNAWLGFYMRKRYCVFVFWFGDFPVPENWNSPWSSRLSELKANVNLLI